MECLTLIARAKAAGLSISVNGPKLVVRGPQRSTQLARELLVRKAEVMAALAPEQSKSETEDGDTTLVSARKTGVVSTHVFTDGRRVRVVQVRCQRCASPDFTDTPIHGGRSVRRDCAQCGITWGFPMWFGVVNEG
jgi:hypothetical protein